MSDIREDVAKAIADELGYVKDYQLTDVAIAAAEPHLRRKHRQELLDEMIAGWSGGDGAVVTAIQAGMLGYLKALKEAE